MKTEKIKAGLIDFTSGHIGCEELSTILLSATNPSILIRQLTPSLSTSTEMHAAAKIICREKMDAVFSVFTQEQIAYARLLSGCITAEGHRPQMFAVCEPGEVQDMMEVPELGYHHWLTVPLQREEVLSLLRKITGHCDSEDNLTHDLKKKVALRLLVGRNPHFLREIEKIPVVATCNAGILISGETGTGKELCARAIHHLSLRAKKPFIAASCGAMPVDLIENEFFGHVRGAFTGADMDQAGLICEADSGTLFLDEVDCLHARAQVKLLRFIQEKEFKKLGSSKTRTADVRVIAAANTNLEQATKKGLFRQDLYYRLNVIPISLPPLRRRKDDIPVLAQHFLQKYAFEYGKGFKDISGEALEKLVAHDWPGNIRELENVVQRAVILSKNITLRASDIDLPSAKVDCGNVTSFQEAKNRFIRTYIVQLLEHHQGNISRAAKDAQKNRRAFWELMRKYDISAANYKTYHHYAQSREVKPGQPMVSYPERSDLQAL